MDYGDEAAKTRALANVTEEEKQEQEPEVIPALEQLGLGV